MSNSSPNHRPDDQAGTTQADLAALSRLVAGLSREQLLELHERVMNREAFAKHLAKSLGSAVRLAEQDRQWREAIAPVVADGVLTTAQREPGRLGQAIAPALMPAMRRMIVLSITELTEGIETLMRDAFSVQGLKWRIESWRTGRPVAELVFRDTFKFRVDHVMLSHRQSGVLLQDVSREGTRHKDPAVVASMVGAVSEFVAEAFASGDEDAGDRSMRVGENQVLVEALGDFALAAVVRGSPPASLRRELCTLLEQIVASHGQRLAAFDGDVSPFEDLETELRHCLRSETHNAGAGKVVAGHSTGRGGDSRRAMGLAGAVAALMMVLWAGAAWRAGSDAHDWNAFLDAVDTRPGVMVVSASRHDPRHDDRPSIRLLIDPDARDPRPLGKKLGFPAVQWSTEAFQSQDPQVVLARAYRLLSPPQGVTLTLEHGTLRPIGVADAAFEQRLSAIAVPGVSHTDASVIYVR